MHTLAHISSVIVVFLFFRRVKCLFEVRQHYSFCGLDQSWPPTLILGADFKNSQTTKQLNNFIWNNSLIVFKIRSLVSQELIPRPKLNRPKGLSTTVIKA